mgnify:CR=1 FL=1
MRPITISILGFFLLTFLACDGPIQEEDTPLEHQAEESIHSIQDGDLEILEIDGCEYLVYKEHLSMNQGFG